MRDQLERLYHGFFYINVLYVLVLGYLTVLTALYVRASPVPQFTATKAALVGTIALFLAHAALKSDHRGNLMLSLALTLTLVVTQIAFQSPFLAPDFPARVTRKPTPYMMFAGQPHARDHNALGYRGELPPADKGDAYRIFMLGGSTVYGGESREPLPSLLEAVLHENGSRQTEVYNWGVASQVSGQEITTILHRVVDYDPDLVLLYGGANDIIVPYSWDPRPGYPFNFVLFEQGPAILQERDLTPLSAMTVAQSDLIRTLFRQELEQFLAPVAQLRIEVDYGSEPWEEAIADAYLGNLDRACHLAEGFDFRVVAVLQPLMVFNPDPEYGGENIPEYRAYLLRQYDRVRAGYEELAAQYGDEGRCFFIDLSQICSDAECKFRDEAHVSTKTRAYIARELFRRLDERELIP